MSQLTELSAKARREFAASADAGALRVMALIDLVTASDGAMIDRSVVQLAEAQARLGEAPGLSNELAVAYAARAETWGDPQDLYRALDQIERAVGRDSGSAVWEFNRAWILDRLHLLGESAAAWQSARMKEADPSWTGEIDERAPGGDVDAGEWFRQRLRAWEGGEASALDSAVARFPQMAREHAQDVLLPAWGDAVLGGASGVEALRTAEALAGRLRRMHGVGTLEFAVAAIRGSPGARAKLARGWSAYGAGRANFRDAKLDVAAAQLDAAIAAFGSNDVAAARWARLYRAVIAMYSFRYGSAESELGGLLAGADTAADRPFAARVSWALGFSQTRRGAPGEAVPHLESGVRLARAAGEAESEAATNLILGEALGTLGRTRAAARAVARASALYRPYRGATSLHSLLLVTGRRLAETGLPFAGVAVHREGVRVAGATGRAKDPVEAYTWLARAQADAGANIEARQNLAEAERALPSVADTLMRTRLRMENLAARAQLELATDPRQGIDRITPVLAYYEAGQLAFGQRDALSRRARARLQLGDIDGALEDNTRVIEGIERQLAGLRQVGARAALLDSAATAFDGVIAIHAEAGNTDVALEYAERSRAVFAAARGFHDEHADSVSLANLRDRVPEDAIILEYVVLPDRVAVWAIARGIVTPGGVPIAAADLEALVRRFVNLTRIGADTTVLHELGAQLWSFLIAPVQSALRSGQPLVIVADRTLHDLPFAALRAPGGRYLIQDHPLRHAPSALFVAATATAALPRAPRLLAVGNSAVDEAAFPDIDPLPSAAREMTDVSSLYTAAARLEQQAATKSALLRQMPQFDILHFAGHARLRSDRPDQSFLIVAPEPGAREGTVYGSDIAGLDLRGLELAVLSACATLTPAATRNGGLSGLAHSFLAAGAGGVVGTLWEVADASTADLMVGLHRSLGQGATPAEALRTAQLALMTSTDPRLRHPAAWAPFRYEGR